MLVGLRLQNIALHDSVEISFDCGFTVLTGETGAGKSILLDALDALFGSNQSLAQSNLLRPGALQGCIEASFVPNSLVKAWMESEGFELDGENPEDSHTIKSYIKNGGYKTLRSVLKDLNPQKVLDEV